MRVSSFALRLTLAAGAALTLAACGSRPAATNVATNAASAANALNTPMNDASAVETTANAGIAAPPSNLSNAADTAPPPPPPSGNTQVQSNIAGM